MLMMFSQLPALIRVFAMQNSLSSPTFELMHSSPPAALQSRGKSSATKRSCFKYMDSILEIEAPWIVTTLK